MKLEQKTTATVRMRPVCECGYVFPTLYCHEVTADTLGGVQIKKHYFEPARCPNCEKLIETVESIPVEDLLHGGGYE